MPEIHPSSIVSFSSEDKEYPASNLLTPTSFKKWQCEKPSDKSATVEFQLSKAEKISQIDIGNAGSAFIEVLVRRSSNDSDDYQCLLVSSSFMSPIDVRSRTSLNRVRIFKTDKLSRLIQEQKWDRIRVVCSQPFPPKTDVYGLSFIRFYTSEGPTPSTSSEDKTKQETLARFTIRDEDDEDEAAGSVLFKKRKNDELEDISDEESKPTSSNIASQIRAASKVAEEEFKKTKNKTSSKKEDVPSSSSSVRKRSSDEEPNESSRPNPKRVKKESPKAKGSDNPRKREKRPSLDASDSDKEEANSSLRSVMRGVVFVLSGYQNPLRARLRDMAIDMGAKYSADWSPSCTHLICAFVSTPKYKSVSGKGRIVTDKWITECNKRRKLLPWRDFRLGRATSPPGTDDETRSTRRRPARGAIRESDEEEDSDDEEIIPSKVRRSPPKRHVELDDADDDIIGTTDDEDSEEERIRRKRKRLKKNKKGEDSEDEWKPSKNDKSEESEPEDDEESEKSEESEAEIDTGSGGDDEVDVTPEKKKERSKTVTQPKAVSPKKKQSAPLLDSGSDSNGGWAPIRRKKGGSDSAKKKKKTTPSPNKSPIKSEQVEDPSRADLPVLFDTSFFMYGKFKDGLERTLRRIIIGYGGKLEQYMNGNVKFVVTCSDWDDNFDDALMSNSSLVFVRPQWLVECDLKRRYLPYQKYQVVGQP